MAIKIKKRKPKHAVKIFRASIRVSLNKDTGSVLRAKLKKFAFEPNGFINDPGAHGTGSWINVNCSVQEMHVCMSELWRIIEEHDGPGKVDHVWSNFEMIDLRSFFKGAKKKDRMSDELKSFLVEQGLEKGSKE